jgi:hypothetical protein
VTTTAGTDLSQGPRYCANHPRVETGLSCSSCGKPICPDCMVQAAVGIKCRECARMPRSARVTLKPRQATRAVAAAFGAGTGFGVLLAYAGAGLGLGFLTFIIAYVVGLFTGRAVLAATGRYRSTTTGWIAAGGAAWAYVVPAIVVALATSSGVLKAGVQVLGLLIAGFVAYREVVS